MVYALLEINLCFIVGAPWFIIKFLNYLQTLLKNIVKDDEIASEEVLPEQIFG